jgi:hypothetical protein
MNEKKSEGNEKTTTRKLIEAAVVGASTTVGSVGAMCLLAWVLGGKPAIVIKEKAGVIPESGIHTQQNIR